MTTLQSQIDESINFVAPVDDGGFFETRYVRRPASDFSIIYLSSHSGCNKACRFCHLTSTKQTMMKPATFEDFERQAVDVFRGMDWLEHAPSKVSYSFMARGEPLANPHLVSRYPQIAGQLENIAKNCGKQANFKISTIMPEESLDIDLTEHFGFESLDTTLFYSLYSVMPDFRRKWLPKALSPRFALNKLAKWEKDTRRQVVIHFPLIRGENDDLGDIHRLIDAVEFSGLRPRFNLIRYNAPNEKSSESSQWRYDTILGLLNTFFPGSQIIDRVGFDVKASCGMFVTKEDIQ